MRHPLLRILVALIIGVSLPLCCCQAMMLVGGACDGASDTVELQASCCPSCLDESSGSRSPTPVHTPSNDENSHPDDCPSCPSCQGLSGGAGLKVEAKLPALEQQWNALATIAIAVFFDLPKPDEAIVPGCPSRWGSPPHVKANRDAQRWHCALTI